MASFWAAVPGNDVKPFMPHVKLISFIKVSVRS